MVANCRRLRRGCLARPSALPLSAAAPSRSSHRLTRDMPAWSIVYLVIIGAVSAWAVVDDLGEGKSRARSVVDVAAIVTLGYLFVAHFVPRIGAPVGRLAAPLFVAALLWTGIAAH